MTAKTTLPGGTFIMAEDLTVTRVGYGAIRLAGRGVFGSPRAAGTMRSLPSSCRLRALPAARRVHAAAIRHTGIDCYPPQHHTVAVARASLLQRSPNILLNPGTSSVAHLRESVAGAAMTLSEDDLSELNRIAS